MRKLQPDLEMDLAHAAQEQHNVLQSMLSLTEIFAPGRATPFTFVS
jgi:hypothetical protein